jgi:hypothetical protein
VGDGAGGAGGGGGCGVLINAFDADGSDRNVANVVEPLGSDECPTKCKSEGPEPAVWRMRCEGPGQLVAVRWDPKRPKSNGTFSC